MMVRPEQALVRSRTLARKRELPASHIAGLEARALISPPAGTIKDPSPEASRLPKWFDSMSPM